MDIATDPGVANAVEAKSSFRVRCQRLRPGRGKTFKVKLAQVGGKRHQSDCLLQIFLIPIKPS
jgi:hypothetical protein